MNSQNNLYLTDHYVNVRGYRTRYWDVGFSDSVVILIHGFCLSCEIWKQNIEELSKHHRVIAPDFWGAGKTDACNKKVDIDEYPEFIIWLMDALKIQKASLIGHSLGGLIALRAAYKHPDYINKIMLVGSVGFTKSIPLHFRLFVLPGIGELMAKPNKKGLKHALAHNTYEKNIIPEDLVESLFEYSQKPLRSKHILNLARSGMTFLGFRGSLLRVIKKEARSLRCPVLVLWGKNDRILSYKSVFRAKQLIPNVNIEIFDKCGHLPQMEHPARFHQITHSFLTTA